MCYKSPCCPRTRSIPAPPKHCTLSNWSRFSRNIASCTKNFHRLDKSSLMLFLVAGTYFYPVAVSILQSHNEMFSLFLRFDVPSMVFICPWDATPSQSFFTRRNKLSLFPKYSQADILLSGKVKTSVGLSPFWSKNVQLHSFNENLTVYQKGQNNL